MLKVKLFVAFVSSTVILLAPFGVLLFIYSSGVYRMSARISAGGAAPFIIVTVLWGMKVWYPNYVAWRMRGDIERKH